MNGPNRDFDHATLPLVQQAAVQGIEIRMLACGELRASARHGITEEQRQWLEQHREGLKNELLFFALEPDTRNEVKT